MKNKRIILGFIVGIVIVLSLWLISRSELSPLSSSPPPDASSPPPNAFPPPSAASSPPTSTVLVDDIIRDLQWGNIVFNAPTAIQFEGSEVVELLLSSTKPIRQLQSELDRRGETESAKIKISNRMKANLSGQGFNVQALFPEEQAIRSEATTRWKWEVTPVEEGSRNLYLSLSAIVTVAGRDAPFVVRTYSKDIEVAISTGQRASKFFSSNWQWLWAAILVPVVTFLWQRYRKKVSKKQPNNSDAADG